VKTATALMAQLGLALGILLVVGLALAAAATSEVWLPPTSPTPTFFAPRPVTFFTPVVIQPGQPTPTLSLATSTLSATGVLLPTPTPCLPPIGWVPVSVGPGESLASLAQRFRTTVELLRKANCLFGDTLPPGSLVYVPPPLPTPTAVVRRCGPPPTWIVHVVQRGENLFRLSLAYGVSVAQLQWANCLSGTLIFAGQRLFVPPVAATNTPFDWTPSPTPTATATATPSRTPTPSITPTPGPSPTATPTVPSPTATPTTPLPTATFTATPTPTFTATATATFTATATATPSPTPTPTPTFSATPTPTFTASPAP